MIDIMAMIDIDIDIMVDVDGSGAGGNGKLICAFLGIGSANLNEKR